MSNISNYDTAAQNYDKGRTAVAADVIIGLIKTHVKKDIKELHVLDAGCGTGNYSIELLKFGVNKVSMVDGSPGMLSVAKSKIDAMSLSERIEMKEAVLPAIPFGDNTFDVVMVNQVLHHITKNPDGESYPGIMSFLSEAKRVLKRNGLLIITATTREQLSGRWYFYLNVACGERYKRKVPRMKSFIDMLDKTGYHVLNCLSVLGNDCLSRYQDCEGPLDKAYRDSDSFWSSLTDTELVQYVSLVRRLKEDGQLKEFFNKYEKTYVTGAYVVINATICK